MSKRKRVYNSQNYAIIQDKLRKKYFDLYMASYKWTGLDYRQEDFVKRKLYDEGSIAAFKIDTINEIGFATWTEFRHDMYEMPEQVTLNNPNASPVVPYTVQVVDEDVVLGWIQSNHHSIRTMVDWYIDRIAQVELVINTNLMLQKMPYVIPVDVDNKDKVNDLVDRILNDEIIITVENVDVALLKALATQAPYIIDKLRNYQKDIESDLKTFLGINNPGENKIEQLQMSETNANNAEIGQHAKDFENNLKAFCERVKETLGFDISVEFTTPLPIVEGETHTFEDMPGPKKEME